MNSILFFVILLAMLDFGFPSKDFELVLNFYSMISLYFYVNFPDFILLITQSNMCVNNHIPIQHQKGTKILKIC